MMYKHINAMFINIAQIAAGLFNLAQIMKVFEINERTAELKKVYTIVKMAGEYWIDEASAMQMLNDYGAIPMYHWENDPYVDEPSQTHCIDYRAGEWFAEYYKLCNKHAKEVADAKAAAEAAEEAAFIEDFRRMLFDGILPEYTKKEPTEEGVFEIEHDDHIEVIEYCLDGDEFRAYTIARIEYDEPESEEAEEFDDCNDAGFEDLEVSNIEDDVVEAMSESDNADEAEQEEYELSEEELAEMQRINAQLFLEEMKADIDVSNFVPNSWIRFENEWRKAEDVRVPRKAYGILEVPVGKLINADQIPEITAIVDGKLAEAEDLKNRFHNKLAEFYNTEGSDYNTQNAKIKRLCEIFGEKLNKIAESICDECNSILKKDGKLGVVHAGDKVNFLRHSPFWEIVRGKAGELHNEIIFVNFDLGYGNKQYADNKKYTDESKLMKRIIRDGFDCDGYHYVKYGASAGMTRNKKMVFIREDVYQANKQKLLGGLQEFEECGWLNDNDKPMTSPGKIENYKCLLLSQVIKRHKIDWSKVIMVDERTAILKDRAIMRVSLEEGTMEERTEDIEIKLDDGQFLINANTNLPLGSYRALWFKGLGVPMFFDQWYGMEIVDANGVARKITEDTIAIINTSVLKMHGAYNDDMELYGECVLPYIWECKPDVEECDEGRMNYQMVQDLRGTCEDAKQLAELAVELIRMLKQSPKERYEYISNTNNNFAAVLKKYPRIMDTDMLKHAIESLCDVVRNNVDKCKWDDGSAYRFVAMDPVYVMTTYLGNPVAAIPENCFVNVSFKEGEMCDILRAPHMITNEHCIRKSIKVDLPVPENNAVYMSCLDESTIVLNNDNDGDTVKVLPESNPITQVAMREQQLPLVYKIYTANKLPCDLEHVFEFYRNSYKPQKSVGTYALAANRVWANPELSYEDKLKAVAMLTQAGNNAIDSAKTGRTMDPKKGSEVDKFLNKASNCKESYFVGQCKKIDEEKCLNRPTEMIEGAQLPDNVIACFHDMDTNYQYCGGAYGDADINHLRFKVEDVSGHQKKVILRGYNYLCNLGLKTPSYVNNPPYPELFGYFKLGGFALLSKNEDEQIDMARQALESTAAEVNVSIEQMINVILDEYGFAYKSALIMMLYGNEIAENINPDEINKACDGDGDIWDATDNVRYNTLADCRRALGFTCDNRNKVCGLTKKGKKQTTIGHLIFDLGMFKGIVDDELLANPNSELAPLLISIMQKM